ncbi:response regulator transcription factor [Chloroflexota bacterium]
MNKKILVVEDDPSSLRLTTYVLESNGYEVLSAMNGLEGLKKAQNENPDLVILDVMLPGIDGFEICNHLRADPKTASISIIMLSAKARGADKETGLKMGANDYITKPISPSDILKRVEGLLAGKTAGTQPGSIPVPRKTEHLV